MNFVLIVTLFIIFFSILQGWRKGVIGIVFGFVSWIFVLLFVAFSHSYIEAYVRANTHAYEKIYEQSLDTIEEKRQIEYKETKAPAWAEELKKSLPSVLSEKDWDQSPLLEKEMTEEEIAALQVADFIMEGIAVLISFVIAEIAVAIVGGIVKSVGRIPVVKEVNSLLGIIAGAVEGFLVVWLLMYLIICFYNTEYAQLVIGYIHQNEFLTYLYNHNLVMVFIASI